MDKNINGTQWNIQEVKHLRKKQLVQNNIVMLLLFVLFSYLAVIGNHSTLFGVFCLLLWIISAITFYSLKTSKPIGTKTSRYMQVFDRNRLGDKRWKRRKIIEFIIIIIICVLITILIIVLDISAVSFDLPMNAIPFIGAWVGYNIGEVIRMKSL